MFASGAYGFVWVSGHAELYNVGGEDVEITGNDHDFVNTIYDPDSHPISFDRDMEILTANSTYVTWGHSYNGKVLFTGASSHLRISFDHEVYGWGMNFQQNVDDDVVYSIELSNGIKRTMSVNGIMGYDAAFLGFCGGAIDWIDLEIVDTPNEPYPLGFAVGQMVVVNNPVPEPSTLILMGIGFAGVSLYRRFRKV